MGFDGFSTLVRQRDTHGTTTSVPPPTAKANPPAPMTVKGYRNPPRNRLAITQTRTLRTPLSTEYYALKTRPFPLSPEAWDRLRACTLLQLVAWLVDNEADPTPENIDLWEDIRIHEEAVRAVADNLQDYGWDVDDLIDIERSI